MAKGHKRTDLKAKEKFLDFLSNSKLSRSKSRMILFDLVYSIHDHFEPDEILKIAKKKRLQISKASLYRNLALLEESGFIRRVQFTDKHAHYEHVHGHDHHEHLICTECGKIVDFFSEEIEEALEKVSKLNGFESSSHKVEIVGLCEDCRG